MCGLVHETFTPFYFQLFYEEAQVSPKLSAFTPTRPDTGRITGLPYGWPNLPDKIDFGSLDLFGSFFQYRL